SDTGGVRGVSAGAVGVARGGQGRSGFAGLREEAAGGGGVWDGSDRGGAHGEGDRSGGFLSIRGVRGDGPCSRARRRRRGGNLDFGAGAGGTGGRAGARGCAQGAKGGAG